MKDNFELQKKYGAEQVFVLPYTETAEIPDGYTPIKSIIKELDMSKGSFVLRCDAEGNPALQQIIPCAVIRDMDGNVFVSKRIDGDDRLKGKLSVTFGGHINPCDAVKCHISSKDDIAITGLRRELGEETTLYDDKKFKKQDILPEMASINEKGYVRQLDSTTPEHIGIIYEVCISKKVKRILKIRETDTLEGIWMTTADLIREIERFEGWSQLIIAEVILEEEKK